MDGEKIDENDIQNSHQKMTLKRHQVLQKNTKILIAATATKHFEHLFAPLVTHFPDSTNTRMAKLALLDAMEAYTDAIENSEFEPI